MTKKCIYCGKFYIQKQEEKMCNECKKEYEIAFKKVMDNKNIQDVCKRLADR